MYIYDTMNLELLRRLEGHQSGVNTIKFTSDGTYCMTCSDDRSAILWNPHRDDPGQSAEEVESKGARGLLIKSYSGVHGYPIYDIAITEDKNRFATAGGDRVCYLWDVSTGRVIRRIQGHSQRVNTVCFNESASLMISGSYDKTVCVWDLKSNMREPVQTISDFRDSVTSVLCSSHEIVAGSVDGTVRTFDIRSGQAHTDDMGDPVTCVRQSPDQKCLLATTLGGPVFLLDKKNGAKLQQYAGRKHSSFKLESTFCGDEKHIVGASEDGVLRFWGHVDGVPRNVRTTGRGGAPLHRSSSSNSSSAILGVAAHPKDPVVLSCNTDGSAACWRYSTTPPQQI